MKNVDLVHLAGGFLIVVPMVLAVLRFTVFF